MGPPEGFVEPDEGSSLDREPLPQPIRYPPRHDTDVLIAPVHEEPIHPLQVLAPTLTIENDLSFSSDLAVSSRDLSERD
jgi:hypothetical protein